MTERTIALKSAWVEAEQNFVVIFTNGMPVGSFVRIIEPETVIDGVWL